MKIGVLGMGSIGTRHAKNLSDLGHEVMIHDPLFDSVREHVIAEADAVVIATPTRCHYDDLYDCIEAGKKIFCEKPIAATRQEWEMLAQWGSINDVFVGYNARFHPCVTRAKAQLDDGAIGRPLYGSFACAQYSSKPDYLRDGVTLNWSHEIDLARHLLGSCAVFGTVLHVEDGKDDMADLFMVHGGKVRTSVHLNYLTNPQVRGFHLVGTGGALWVDLVRGIIECEGQQTHFGAPQALWDRTYIEEMKAFVDFAEGWAPGAPAARGDDGLAVLDLCLVARKLGGLWP